MLAHPDIKEPTVYLRKILDFLGSGILYSLTILVLSSNPCEDRCINMYFDTELDVIIYYMVVSNLN